MIFVYQRKRLNLITKQYGLNSGNRLLSLFHKHDHPEELSKKNDIESVVVTCVITNLVFRVQRL